jgi:hypothetical protein
MSKILLLPLAFVLLFLLLTPVIHAQTAPLTTILPSATPTVATTSAGIATQSAEIIKDKTPPQDITKPEEDKEKEEILALFQKRPIEEFNALNVVAFIVQNSVKAGVPSNTVILILLLPLLATIIAFLRHVVGIPSLELILPIALSITLLATGITTGLVLLLTILIASTIARFILKKIRIMQLPKLALSMFVVALFVFLSLTVMATTQVLNVSQISIFPILLLILLSERIVALQIERSNQDTIIITTATIALALVGLFLFSNTIVRDFVILYPESMFLLIPLNIAIGRYFGLRVSEYFRFDPLIRHGNK